MSKGAFRARISSFPKICLPPPPPPPGRYHARRLFHRRVEIRKRGGERGERDETLSRLSRVIVGSRTRITSGTVKLNGITREPRTVSPFVPSGFYRVSVCPVLSCTLVTTLPLPRITIFLELPRLISRYTREVAPGCRGESLGWVTRSETGPTGTLIWRWGGEKRSTLHRGVLRFGKIISLLAKGKDQYFPSTDRISRIRITNLWLICWKIAKGIWKSVVTDRDRGRVESEDVTCAYRESSKW